MHTHALFVYYLIITYAVIFVFKAIVLRWAAICFIIREFISIFPCLFGTT